MRLRTVALDREGIIPESLDEACRTGNPTALYCISSFQNPTAAFMSDERRQQIANVAIEHRLTVIEDDVFGFLAPEVKPLSSYLPDDQFFYITSTSKSIAPGIRIGYLLQPASAIERLSCPTATIVNAPRRWHNYAHRSRTAGAGRISEYRRRSARPAIAARVARQGWTCIRPEALLCWCACPTRGVLTRSSRARHRAFC